MRKTMRLLAGVVWQQMTHVDAEDALNALALGLIAATAVMLASLVI